MKKKFDIIKKTLLLLALLIPSVSYSQTVGSRATVVYYALIMGGTAYSIVTDNGDTVEIVAKDPYWDRIYSFDSTGYCNKVTYVVSNSSDYVVRLLTNSLYYNKPSYCCKSGYRLYRDYGEYVTLARLVLRRDNLAMIELTNYTPK